MSEKLNAARQKLIDEYTAALTQNKIPWECSWKTQQPRNAITNRPYSGINRLLPNCIADARGYKGTRWCTFNQISDQDGKYHPSQQWHLKKGSKSVPIEYWYVFNINDRRKYSFEEYRSIIRHNPEQAQDFRLCSKTYNVFNEDCIEGLLPVVTENKSIAPSAAIERIIDNMGVTYREAGQSAYYSPRTDTVVIPPRETFDHEYGYHATQLHELCHATGHESRLNRNIKNSFGSPDYAKEELRAEIGASFLMQEFGLAYDESHAKNHMAYVQSWIEILKNDPNELFRAIHSAEEITEYIQNIAGLQPEQIHDVSPESLPNKHAEDVYELGNRTADQIREYAQSSASKVCFLEIKSAEYSRDMLADVPHAARKKDDIVTLCFSSNDKLSVINAVNRIEPQMQTHRKQGLTH